MKDFTPCEHGSHPMGCIQCQLAVQPPATPQEPTGAQLALADIEKAYAETEVALAQVVSRNDKELFFNGDKALRAHLQKNLDYYRIRRDGVRALLASAPPAVWQDKWDTHQSALRALVAQWRQELGSDTDPLDRFDDGWIAAKGGCVEALERLLESEQ